MVIAQRMNKLAQAIKLVFEYTYLVLEDLEPGIAQGLLFVAHSNLSGSWLG